MTTEEYQALFEARQKEYNDALNNAPVRKKPGFWRTLAATAAGAVGGWNFDRGGMQWGQNLANEIVEGPYKREYDEYMQKLEASRRGTDQMQQGLNNRLRLEEIAEARQLRKEMAEAKRIADQEKSIDIFKTKYRDQSKGAAQEVGSMEEAQERFGEDIKKGLKTVVQSATTDRSGKPVIMVVPTDQYWRKLESDEVTELQPTFNKYADLFGLPRVDVSRLRPEDRRSLFQMYQREIASDTSAKNSQEATRRMMMGIVAATNRQANAQEFRANQTEGARSKDIWDDTQYRVMLIDRDYNGRIERARAEGRTADVERLVRDREVAKADLLNTAHLRDAQLRKKPEVDQFEVEPGTNKMKKKTVRLDGGQAVSAPQAAPRQLQPGTVEDGYVFMGGDPTDPKNWKPE